MRRQIEHLIEVTTELEHVVLQVVPFMKGGHASAGRAFSILSFAQPELPDIVYLEQLTSALYLDRRKDVDHYLLVLERLCLEAESAVTARKTLKRLLREL
jgi:hypothetical protein